MPRRYLSIWFRHLLTDWHAIRQPAFRQKPFVLVVPDHGRKLITAANPAAEAQGLETGMVLADAIALLSSLQYADDRPGHAAKLLKGIANWCIRFTPTVSVCEPDGLCLDITGCAHLWGGEKNYLQEMQSKLFHLGYQSRAGIADTVGASWGISRFSAGDGIIESGHHASALLTLPPQALRLEHEIVVKLHKLGLTRISDFAAMPRSALRRRFGPSLINRLDQALGYEDEPIQPLFPVEVYQERLPCPEPIVTRTGIDWGLQQLLKNLCAHLQQDEKGLRICLFKAFRVDGKMETLEIGTNRASSNPRHLFKLFELKLDTIDPGLGIELFMLDAQKVEDVSSLQQKFWETDAGLNGNGISELMDRLAGKIGSVKITRYLPDEHYWPERSVKPASSLHEKSETPWSTDRPRPLQLLPKPEPVEVTAPIPDYPPMMFRHKGKLHKIVVADGPERIEQEWWIQQGQHRDYYAVEDEEGQRYWLFRLGHYDAERTYQWFIHGFFA